MKKINAIELKLAVFHMETIMDPEFNDTDLEIEPLDHLHMVARILGIPPLELLDLIETIDPSLAGEISIFTEVDL